MNTHDTTDRLHGEPHDDSRPTPHHTVPYVQIFFTLVALTIITVAVSRINVKSELIKVLLALTIAATKASFVALYFMHMKFEGKLIRLIMSIPLVLMFILVFALIPDILTTLPTSSSSSLHVFNDMIGSFRTALGLSGH